MEKFAEEFIDGKTTQDTRSGLKSDDLDRPPKDFLVDPNFNEAGRLRLIEEARCNRLHMEEQRREAVHQAREEIEARIPTLQKPASSERGSQSKRRRHRQRRNHGGQSRAWASQPSLLSQDRGTNARQLGSYGAVEPTDGIQGQWLPQDAQPAPTSPEFND
ncbi:uncharacterized protein Z519_00172 [Cladophialophora bantiana CBS 173.52]|uniref:Uncharacterized protein n=1 Tax=Cladophialophora bantiana (strain ATCC 10958 / CBS 173.52 / CDC B-1940 / NIH 8579) TaxID=1442370 RepID=A0A0D2F8Y8_CLAB1|nr:uncharacterized protein Z519_00172 [Cladophialophora bantiana CBS 173.52]KIW98511.1 hypothetical protein Z519_00172 [Cladophialophora bantiana CBS 173.52]